MADGEGLEGDLTSVWPCKKREQRVAVLETRGCGQNFRGAYPSPAEVSLAEPHKACDMNHLHGQHDGT